MLDTEVEPPVASEHERTDRLGRLVGLSCAVAVQNVAEVLQLSNHAMRVLSRVRELAGVKIGHSVRIPRLDLECYIADHTVMSHLHRGDRA